MDYCNEILDSSRSTRRSFEIRSPENFRRYESIKNHTLDCFDVGGVFWFAYLWSFLILIRHFFT